MASVPFATHWFGLRRYWRYYWQARTAYDVHSPFLSTWVQAVLEDQRRYYIQGDMRGLRAWWQASPVRVTFSQDFGAGSRAGQGTQRTASQLARWSGIDEDSGMQLFRIARLSRANRILELGTNLGFSAAYLRAARRNAQILTLEGQAEVARLAEESFRRLRLSSPDIHVGEFEQTLPIALTQLSKIDLAFLDGDHRSEPTARYLDMIWPYLHEESIVIIGDIHWSPDMEQAWEAAKQRQGVTLSVDLFHMGILFLRPAQRQPEQYTLIPTRYKPWRLGFFRGGST